MTRIPKTSPTDQFRRALASFDDYKFVYRHKGRKESPSPRTREFLFDCPSCGSSRLRWNAVKHTWICWGCGITGDTVKLVQIMERCDELGAIQYIMDGYVGGDAKIDSLESILPQTVQTPKRGDLRELPQMAWPSGVEVIDPDFFVHKDAVAYLHGRGITSEQIKQYRLGYGRIGRFAGYVIFPCFINFRMVYFQGRASWNPPEDLDKEERKAWIEHTGYKKTMNPTHRGNEAFGHEVIFNHDLAKASPTVVICEGPVDAIKSGTNAVALLGKAISPEKLSLLANMAATTFVVYLDPGAEERKVAEQLASELSAFGDVYIATPPEGFDPGDLSLEQNAHIISQAERFRPGTLSSNLAS